MLFSHGYIIMDGMMNSNNDCHQSATCNIPHNLLWEGNICFIGVKVFIFIF